MRAVTYSAYGPIERLELSEVASPKPGARELLVRVSSAALNPKDALFRKGRFRLVSRSTFPKRCGLDFAGTVAESRSPHFHPGDRVFGMLDEWTFRRGSLAEALVCTEQEAAALPDEVSSDAGASLALVGLTSLQALRDIGRVAKGARVLVHGASGGVGTAAVQIARLLGAEVDTTSSAKNLELCRQLGARTAWDYATSALADAAPRFDVVFDVFGDLGFARGRRWLAPRGVLVSTVPSAKRLVRDVLTRWSRQEERLVVVRPRRADLEQLAAWMKARRLAAVIDSRFPLARVHDAFRVIESRRARGKVVIQVETPRG
jgi:NADPH:quinone reductase-like Zn-dependent oxidoreductase